jgi:glycerophosphoryl diester phosphodiesterase
VLYLFLALLTAASLNAGQPLIVAHRGASRDAPENTLPAFQLAWERGADAIEADCHLTSDGHIVCFHDRDAKKLTGQAVIVEQATLEQLRKLDVGAHHGEEFRGTSMPTLAEVLATVPDGRKIYIEVKCGPTIVPGLLREVESSGLAREQVVVISFNGEVIEALEKAVPELRTFWLVNLKRDKRSGELTPALGEILSTLKRIRADGVSTSFALVTRELVETVMREGHEYHVWTVNEAPDARRLRDCGVLSITTDVPGEIRRGLAEEEE